MVLMKRTQQKSSPRRVGHIVNIVVATALAGVLQHVAAQESGVIAFEQIERAQDGDAAAIEQVAACAAGNTQRGLGEAAARQRAGIKRNRQSVVRTSGIYGQQDLPATRGFELNFGNIVAPLRDLPVSLSSFFRHHSRPPIV